MEQVDFGIIGEYIDQTGEGYAFNLLLAAPDLLRACKAMRDRLTELANAGDWHDWPGSYDVDQAIECAENV